MTPLRGIVALCHCGSTHISATILKSKSPLREGLAYLMRFINEVRPSVVVANIYQVPHATMAQWHNNS